MEQTVHNAEAYDFRQYDRIWQRVAPNLEPYLDMPETPEMTGMAEAMTAASAPSTQQESQLPGATPNPCCMGTAAEEMLDILTGYIEEEMSDRRSILALARQAPSWARQRLRDIAADQANSARRLMAAYYLIRGECYHPSVSMERIYTGRWCPALRERYHAAACNGLNYARSAEDSTDPCLRRLLQELSDLSYAHADALMQMLERSIQR